jgi:hypothetical protein
VSEGSGLSRAIESTTGGDIFEDVKPGTGLTSPKVFAPAEHTAKTRRGLAITVLVMLGILYLIGAVSFVAGLISIEKLTGLIAAVSGLQTLAAAAIGFYFAKDR